MVLLACITRQIKLKKKRKGKKERKKDHKSFKSYRLKSLDSMWRSTKTDTVARSKGDVELERAKEMEGKR